MQGQDLGQASKFQKLFQQEPNTRCLHCGKASRQWAELNLAIFLCPDCVIAFKQFSWVTKIKSVSWEQWKDQEVDRMAQGGNQNFETFLKQYQLELADIRTKVACKASTYYREKLDGKQDLGEQPEAEAGRLIDKKNIPMADMKAQEMVEFAKEKAFWFGGKTKEYGSKGVKTVQQKWQSGQIQEGAVQVAATVSTKAKWLWGKVRDNVSSLTTNNKTANTNENNTNL